MNEDTLRIKLAKSGALEQLGYNFDEDIYWEDTLEDQKRTDITCRDDLKDVVVVFELKKPSVDDLSKHKKQLKERYVLKNKADYGVLYNGIDLILYERKGNQLNRVFRSSCEEIEGEKLDEFFHRLKKPDRTTTELGNVLEYMGKFEEEGDRLNLQDEISREYFYENFQLEEDSVFGRLVVNTIKLFDVRKEKSKFLNSAYQFWKRSYAKELNKSQVPEDWKPLFEEAGLSVGSKEDRYKFTFCLETSYALFTRLILTKSAEDYGFPGDGFSEILTRQLNEASWDKTVPQASYGKMSLKIIREMRGKLISSVFEEDIFYWWTEPFDEREDYIEFHKERTYPTEEVSRFGRSIARVLLTIYKYDFSSVADEDILGVLYQKYFDKKTRKALGEFYTPQEVVEYILDSVGYEGKKVLNERILDPACGSGTFLVEALDRYLKAADEYGKAEREGWRSVLQDLCNKYHILGFDIHPFATIMAQIQFTLKLLPYYQKAIKEEGGYFVLKRLPIFRTDSLEKERRSGTLALEGSDRGQILSMPIELPIQGEAEKEFFEKDFNLPFYETVRDNTPITNKHGYFGALQTLFNAVKDEIDGIGEDEKPEMEEAKLQSFFRDASYIPEGSSKSLASFFKQDADKLLERIKELKHEFDDGRLVKSIEDVMLAAILKNEVKYEYVVGNPPYVRIQDLPDKQKEKWADAYEYAEGNYDIYIPFIERGINWLKSDGKVSYITSNRFLLTNYGELLREKLPEDARIDKLIDMRDSRVFEDALNYPAIFVFSNSNPEGKFKSVRVFKDTENGEELLEDIEEQLKNLSEENTHSVGKYSDAFYVETANLEKSGWYLLPPNERETFDKIRDKGKSLIEITSTGGGTSAMFEGSSTGAKDIFIPEIIEEKPLKVKGPDGRTKKISDDGYKKYAEDSGKWTPPKSGKIAIFPYKINKNGYEIIDEDRFSSQCSDSYSYLEMYKEKIKHENRQSLSQSQPWYAYSAPRSLDKAVKKKIIIDGFSKYSSASIDEDGEYIFGPDIYGIAVKSEHQNQLKPLVTILNSSITNAYVRWASVVHRNGYYKFEDRFLKKLPIKLPGNDLKDKIEDRFDKIADFVNLKEKIRFFPKPYMSKLVEEEEISEWDEIKHTTSRRYSPLNIKRQKDLKGNEKIKLGKDDFIESHKIDSEVKRNYIIKAVDGKKFSKEEQIVIPLPKSDKAVKKILEMLEEDKKKLEENKSTEELEEELNELVFDLYDISGEQQEVVEDFLKKF